MTARLLFFFPGEDREKPSPDHYAICGFPVDYQSGRRTFIMRQGGIIHAKEIESNEGVTVYPGDVIGEGWEEVTAFPGPPFTPR